MTHTHTHTHTHRLSAHSPTDSPTQQPQQNNPLHTGGTRLADAEHRVPEPHDRDHRDPVHDPPAHHHQHTDTDTDTHAYPYTRNRILTP